MIGLLSLLIGLPLLGAFSLLVIPKERTDLMRILALSVSFIVLFCALALAFSFDASDPRFQFVERYEWSADLGISYAVGVDGLSLWLIALAALLTPLSLLLSTHSIQKRVRAFLIAFLVLESGLIGVFVSLDLFLFYIFWELVLIPMYFIIGIWGHKERLYATTKFVIYTLVGSLLMLVGILGLVTAHLREFGILTFDLTRLYGLGLSLSWQGWIFFCLFMGFAIKVPLFPFHTWLPDAHVQAPAAGSVMLAGVLLKMGVYGFLRISLPMLPEASMAALPWIIVLGVVGIIYGSLVALAQDDMKRLIAYSSVAHLGFCIIGIFSLTHEGVSGGVLQMINHGLSTGALFLLVGMLYERTHSHKIADYGGLARSMPRFTAVFGVIVFSSIGLPGLNNFVGEFLSLYGLFQVLPGVAIIGLLGIILAAWYMLWMFQRVFLGPAQGYAKRPTKDLSLRESILISPIVFLVFWIGLQPETLLQTIRPSSARLIGIVQSGFVPQSGPQFVQQEILRDERGGALR